MHGLTDERPKCLVALGGRPLLEWQLRALHAAGLGPVGAVTGYLAEQLAPRVDHTFHSVNWAHTNMVRSLMCAREWLESDMTVVSYADIFYSAATVERLAATEADIAISYDPSWLSLWQERFADPLSDAESFLADDRGLLQDIGRRVGDLSEIQGQYMGLLRFSPAGWQRVDTLLHTLPASQIDRLDMTGLLQRLLEGGAQIAVVPCAGPWGEIDSGDDLTVYEQMIASGRLDLERVTSKEMG